MKFHHLAGKGHVCLFGGYSMEQNIFGYSRTVVYSNAEKLGILDT